MTRSFACSALLVGVILAGGCDSSPSMVAGTGGGAGATAPTGSGGSTDTAPPQGSGGSGSGGSSVNGSGGMTAIDAPMSGDTSDAPAGDMSVGPGARRHGKSIGCGMAAGAAGTQQITIPVCTGCSAKMGNCPRDCIAPEFAPGGASVVGGQNFTQRSYSIRLPADYQPGTAYPVLMGGAGCGGGASGYTPPGVTGAITVALAILTGNHQDGTCFADGGIACSGTAANIPLCVNGPEMAYVRGILSYLESHFCVDLDKEFIGGVSSGAWESTTLGCGDADQLRGFVSIAGGKREHRWPCTGPIAAFMIADTGDSGNPIGPLPQINTPSLDSFGSAPQRDELLIRNGCNGSASTVYDPAYPMCLKYTGCPAAYPVVWCAIPGGHTNTNAGGVNYANAIWPFFKALPPTP